MQSLTGILSSNNSPLERNRPWDLKALCPTAYSFRLSPFCSTAGKGYFACVVEEGGFCSNFWRMSRKAHRFHPFIPWLGTTSHELRVDFCPLQGESAFCLSLGVGERYSQTQASKPHFFFSSSKPWLFSLPLGPEFKGKGGFCGGNQTGGF